MTSSRIDEQAALIQSDVAAPTSADRIHSEDDPSLESRVPWSPPPPPMLEISGSLADMADFAVLRLTTPEIRAMGIVITPEMAIRAALRSFIGPQLDDDGIP